MGGSSTMLWSCSGCFSGGLHYALHQDKTPVTEAPLTTTIMNLKEQSGSDDISSFYSSY